MPHSTRLLLTPVPRPKPTGLAGPPDVVTGVMLKFTQFGADKSIVAVATLPAQIELIGRFFKSVLHDPKERVQSLGVIRGDIWLQGKPLRARFQCDPASLKALSAETLGDPTDPNADRELPRAIDIFFDAESFVPCPSVSPQLILPDFAPQYPYLEVFAEMKVGVMMEAPRGDNDILDVSIWRDSPPRARAYQVQVVDEMGKPIPDVSLSFDIAGTRFTRATAAAKPASVLAGRVNGVAAPAQTQFSDPKALADILKALWNKPSSIEREQWLKPIAGKSTVLSFRQGKLQQLVLSDAQTDQASDSSGVDARSNNARSDNAGVKVPSKYTDWTGTQVLPGKLQTICLQPHVELKRLIGINFDSNKCFLLPNALSMMSKLAALLDERQDDTLVIVGHADASDSISDKGKLSLERAKAMLAFLKNDVDAWIAWYSANDSKQCWGNGEDRQMLRGIVSRKVGLERPDIASYQLWHNTLKGDKRADNWQALKEDGKTGTKTRGQLIGDYMNLDDIKLPKERSVLVHGCGDAFPLPEPEESCAWERYSRVRHRRAEFLFFDKIIGPTPETEGNQISAADSTVYPTWIARAEAEEFTTDDGTKKVTFVEMHDALFRTNSAVILPEGEDPSTSATGGKALTTVGLFATLLRYNAEHPSRVDASGNAVHKKLLIAGHTDTQGSDQFNQPLSEERAKVTLALLMGGQQGRDDFAKLCTARHDGVDLMQIFHWCADALGFDCKPTLWDQPPSTTTISHFKKSYNAHFDAKFKDIPGAKKFPAETGTQDAALWGAIFDCYEYGLRNELGEVENGSTEGKDELERLRGELTWVDDDKKTMGFGERFPVDEVTKNDVRSQSNRRAEVMMFDEGEEPDLDAAAADPEVMETYLPGLYGKTPVKPMASARRVPFDLYINVDRRISAYPQLLCFEMREVSADWSQRRSTKEVVAFDDYRDRMQFRIPPVGMFTLMLTHEGSTPYAIFSSVPYAALTWPGHQSLAAENDEGDEIHEPLVPEQIAAYWDSI